MAVSDVLCGLVWSSENLQSKGFGIPSLQLEKELFHSLPTLTGRDAGISDWWMADVLRNPMYSGARSRRREIALLKLGPVSRLRYAGAFEINPNWPKQLKS